MWNFNLHISNIPSNVSYKYLKVYDESLQLELESMSSIQKKKKELESMSHFFDS